ncbi:hypothetical protein DPSP01_007702 [Paraphaeosphaeria sporulosa]
MAPQKETLLKFTSRRYKSPSVSEEAFHAFATSDHAPKAAPYKPATASSASARYTTSTPPPTCTFLLTTIIQSFKPTALRALLTEGPFAANKPPGWTVDDHDFEIVFYVRSMEQLGGLLGDPEFQQLMADEADICDQERAELSIGWEEVFVENGKVVNIEEGKSVYQGWNESVEKLAGKKEGSKN